MWTRTVPRCAERVSSPPSDEEMPSTGMPMPGRTRVASTGAVRPGVPSLAMRTALAPAAFAFRAFSNMKQEPRRTSATAPRGKPAKAEPVAAARRRVGLDGRDAGGDGSAAGVLQRHEVAPAAVALGAGREALEAGRPASRRNRSYGKLWSRGL